MTILLDNGYHQKYLEQEMERIDPLLREKVTIELSAKITPQQRADSKEENPKKQRFVVIAKRWIVERINAWINQCRVLWKNCEGLIETSETKIRICAIRLILRRIAYNDCKQVLSKLAPQITSSGLTCPKGTFPLKY